MARSPKGGSRPVGARMRCAIYTRKSTEEGLDQVFNSLDAQREACAAYVLSQRHEGWTLLPDAYDDGGFSGGNMERPGLKRLLAEIEAGNVDIVVVYKVDRLTRSLADFAKIVEVLDGRGASFVSITQAFNTTTSMGRLTLNVLLSFAQFEREVTGERIRDKIAASKKKGMWMGGPLPLGYDVLDRKLIVNEPEAELVCHIFQRYLALESVAQLIDELERDGHRTKIQARASGPHRGGCPFRRGTLYHLLSNPIYRGMIVHKGEAFQGEHPPIIPEPLWDQVQATLAARASGTAMRIRADQPSLLVGMLEDGEGRAMTPSHSTRAKRRYRYYVTRPDALDNTPAWRCPAHDLERIICNRIAESLRDRQQLHDLLIRSEANARSIDTAVTAAQAAAAGLEDGTASERVRILRGLRPTVRLSENQITIQIQPGSLLSMLGHTPTCDRFIDPLILTCDAIRVRRGHALRLVIPGPTSAPANPARRDEKLIALIAEAHRARALVMENSTASINRIAADHRRCRTRLAKLLALSCMAPDIITAIVQGRQPATLTTRTLQAIDLPLSWKQQRALLGFA